MAVGTPSHIRATPYAGRQILTDLDLLDEASYPEFIKKYPDLLAENYIITREAQGNHKFTPNKRYWNYSEVGKEVPSFQVLADVSGLAGATVTATVAVAYHKANAGGSGVYSPPAPGLCFENGTNGQVYRVNSKSESVAGAHTVVLQETTGAAISIDADDVLFLAPTVVGEASGTQETIVSIDEKEENECATIKTSQTFSDWNLFEKIDLPGEAAYFKPRQQKKEVRRFSYQQERLLMFGKPFVNVTGVTNNHTGLIPQVKAKGQSDTQSTAINDEFFQNLARLIYAEGYGTEYDGLLNLELRFKLETFLDTKYGATINRDAAFPGDSLEINNNFRAYSVNGLKYNFMTYAHFSNSRLTGAEPNTGFYNNAGLFIPRGEAIDPEDGLNIPRFVVRWQGESAQSPIVRMRPTGGLAPIPTDDVEHLVISHVTYKGIQAFGLNGYLWIQPNFA